MIKLGFSVARITEALEACEFDFTKALRRLYFGMDQARTRDEPVPARLARHHSSYVRRPLELPPGAHQLYVLRAAEHVQGECFTVCDLGMNADGTTVACFWLALAAAWSRCLATLT